MLGDCVLKSDTQSVLIICHIFLSEGKYIYALKENSIMKIFYMTLESPTFSHFYVKWSIKVQDDVVDE